MTMTLDAGVAAGQEARLRRIGKADLAHIPGENGWPVIGNTLKVVSDPLGAAQRMYDAHGSVYRSNVFGHYTVTLIGPEANELVLFDPQKIFSSEQGWGPILGQLFPRGLMLMDFDEHRLNRKAMSVAFKSGPMKSYHAQLNAGIARRIEEWRTKTPDLLFYPAIKQLTLDLAATSFFGQSLGPRGEEIKNAFIDMVAASIGIVRRPLPGTKMGRGVRGRQRIVEIFNEEVPRRRAAQGDDIFTQLCQVTYDDGRLMSDEAIVDHMSFLMMAAHDTLTSSVTTFVWKLAAHPEWQERLRGEAYGLGLGSDGKQVEPLPYERLGDLRLTEMAFKEAMRLNPPVPSVPRRAMREFEFGGYRIPAGAGIGINPLFVHRMPEIWPDPERFDPMRFTDEAVRARHKYAWVPFGGGAHMCLGLHFAYMQAKTFAYHLLTTSRVELAPQARADWQLWPIPQPRDGLPVRIRPL